MTFSDRETLACERERSLIISALDHKMHMSVAVLSLEDDLAGNVVVRYLYHDSIPYLRTFFGLVDRMKMVDLHTCRNT